MPMPVDKQIKWNERSGLLDLEMPERQDLDELETPPKLFMREWFNMPRQAIKYVIEKYEREELEKEGI